MLGADGQAILASLQRVEDLRNQRLLDESLASRVWAVKRFQHERFRGTYADLLADPALKAAATFFLEELYGPHDFSARDAQFTRIVPALVRLFPPEIVGTVRKLAELHALSEGLDNEMASHLDDPRPLEVVDYRRAWQSTGQPDLRLRQIDLMLAVGGGLVRYTRNPLLRAGLRMMRGPAELAGLSALQQFLERGFDTFRQMPDPQGFLATIARREADIARWLFSDSGDLPAPAGFN